MKWLVFLMSLVLITGVYAIGTPLPVTVDVNPDGIYQVQIKNLNTGMSHVIATDSRGIGFIEWRNIDSVARITDSYQFSTQGESLIIQGSVDVSGITAVLNLEGYVPPTECKDIKVDLACGEEYINEACGIRIKAPPCEEWGLEALLTVLFLLGGAGAMIYVVAGKVKLKKQSIDKVIAAMPNGTGLRITKAYTGKGSIKHWHRSPKGYHHLNQRHDGNYDHKGEENLFPDFKESD